MSILPRSVNLRLVPQEGTLTVEFGQAEASAEGQRKEHVIPSGLHQGSLLGSGEGRG